MAKDQRAKKLHEFYLRSGATSIDNTNEILTFKLTNLSRERHYQGYVVVLLKDVAEKDWMKTCIEKLIATSYYNGQVEKQSEIRSSFHAFTYSMGLNLHTESE